MKGAFNTMNTTKHLMDRMNQRGISAKMIELALAYGINKDDKVILDRKNISKLIKEIDSYRKDLLKIMDKDGLVVVAVNNRLLTTYAIN